jgi:HSP20 family protein
VIRELGDSIGSTVLESVGRTLGRAQERRPLPVDLLESDDAYLAVFDAPGAETTDIQVRYDGGAIIVRIDRFRELREGFEMQFPGRGLSLDGRVELPDDAIVDPDSGTATLKDDGTLHVTVPKADDHGHGDEAGGDETSDHEAGDDGTDTPSS